MNYPPEPGTGRINRQVPTKIVLSSAVTVLKHESGIYYHLQYKDGQWYYSVGKEPTTRPLPRAQQGKLNMLAEHYEKRIAELTQKLKDAGIAP